jgi:hypothetical protein
VEFVAISKDYVKTYGYNWLEAWRQYEAQGLLVPDMIDCVFVLCIARTEGVAYRRGTGWMDEAIWNRDKEETLIDLVLG